MELQCPKCGKFKLPEKSLCYDCEAKEIKKQKGQGTEMPDFFKDLFKGK
jgi:uncharacterized OB-fold protein